ncbi:hypothetical protein AVEN_24927-1 [Araneus ventricosus]|uniref:Uncharacterized protein n=1 Tax=Araneus ventricosus TaxID=182803 RepID=A0A4Y2U4I2_ARAVE|nr:hypothetical protein AVEN_24927-1 [Araneus ventricosus]
MCCWITSVITFPKGHNRWKVPSLKESGLRLPKFLWVDVSSGGELFSTVSTGTVGSICFDPRIPDAVRIDFWVIVLLPWFRYSNSLYNSCSRKIMQCGGEFPICLKEELSEFDVFRNKWRSYF